MDSKNVFASKTVWVNGGLAALGTFWQAVQGSLDPQIVVIVAAVANIVLRLVTKQPVTLVK